MLHAGAGRSHEVTMPDITGSYHELQLAPVRPWQRPRGVPRRERIIAQVLGMTRGAKPPPGVAWKRALVTLLCNLLAMMLIVASVYGAP